jgi:hypothetical protein
MRHTTDFGKGDQVSEEARNEQPRLAGYQKEDSIAENGTHDQIDQDREKQFHGWDSNGFCLRRKFARWFLSKGNQLLLDKLRKGNQNAVRDFDDSAYFSRASLPRGFAGLVGYHTDGSLCCGSSCHDKRFSCRSS